MVSKALVVGAYRRKAEELARLGIDLIVFTPPAWGDRRGSQQAERAFVQGYELRAIPLRFNGNYHLHYYPTLAHELAAVRPDILHMDEEPYNLATWLALRTAVRLNIAATFFTWQNILRRYPQPFAALERANYRWARCAIAGNQDAAQVLRAKGYTGDVAVIPQFGVDPDIFRPSAAGDRQPGAPMRIGYAGGLVPEKGVDLLLRACAGLQGNWQLTVAGEGAQQPELVALAAKLGVTGRVIWAGRQPSSAMPEFYRGLDILVLPSRTRSNWKEQFGRVLIEAMACAVPVVGSDSGEIPNVIDGAGLIFVEGDVADLCGKLQRLIDDSQARAEIGRVGRQRVLDAYTMRQIAQQTLAVYSALLG